MPSSVRSLVSVAIVGVSGLVAAGCSTESEGPDDPDTAGSEIVASAPCRPLPASWMETSRLPVDDGKVKLRIGEARPDGPVVGDILFLHGFSDRFDNHRPLFRAWTARGFRVVSFEYPSHGETCGKSLAFYLYPSLARFAGEVERATREDAKRPLLLAGWSMGGLLAVRLLQGLEPLERPVSGALLFTPGVAVHLFLDRVRLETLTRNEDPPHTGPIAPTRPAIYPIAMNILHHAGVARSEALPSGVPVLTVAGGDDEDVYAKSDEIRQWVIDQRTKGGSTYGLSCRGGYHEIDNEPEPMGESVRDVTARFASDTITGVTETNRADYEAGPCSRF